MIHSPQHIGVKNDTIIRHKQGMTNALKHKQKTTNDFVESDEFYAYDLIEDEETQLIKEKSHQRQLLKHRAAGANVRKLKGVSFGFSSNMKESSGGIRHCRGRGLSDLQPPHTSFSPGILVLFFDRT